jgi:DNA polymerase-3 subunit beta
VIKAIEDLESGELFWNDNTVVIEGENTTVLVTRGEYKFPNFRAIIPVDFPSNVTIKRDQLIQALEKCNINSNSLKQMDITLSKKGKVAFTAKDKEFGIDIFVELDADYSGPVDSLKTSSEKMLKLMSQVSYEDIELAIHDKTKPILFRHKESGYLGLLNCLSN